MKNIHILPTTQPSRFSLHTTGLYNLACELHENSPNFSNHHIYITSDEEIKEGDYCVDGNDIYGPYEDGDIATDKFIKIILTTDSQLIRYGVQAIDDEFLEWFVENPTCEFVEVEEIGPGFPAGIYWINYLPEHFEKSIPQEEPKQYPMGSFASGNYWHKECVTCKKEFMGDKRAVQCEPCAIKMTQEEPKQNQDPCNFCSKTLREQMKGCGEITCYRQFITKQETLEEAAEEYAKGKSSSSVFQDAHKRDFIAGAKWQAERMYAEADNIMRFLDTEVELKLSDTKTIERIKWYFKTYFEQFKKK
jgi:hypothetical protein